MSKPFKIIECNYPLNVGCYCACDPIDTGIELCETGVHQVVYDLQGYKRKINIDVIKGENLVLDPKLLPINYDICFHIIQPNGIVYAEIMPEPQPITCEEITEAPIKRFYNQFKLRLNWCICDDQIDSVNIIQGSNLEFC